VIVGINAGKITTGPGQGFCLSAATPGLKLAQPIWSETVFNYSASVNSHRQIQS
jgi:hypothetical protein